MRIGSIAGTAIHVERSFLILAGFFVIIYLEGGTPLREALLWIPVLFVSVLVHELGHAGVIGLMGFGRSHIALAGFGGVTINRRRAKPWQDVVISVAGPICSFGLAWATYLFAYNAPWASRDPALRVFLPMLYQANWIWGLFNLAPLFPLDGGHALHDLARAFTSERKALKFSVWSSIVVGAAMVISALITRWFFVVLIAAMLLHQNWQRLQLLNPRPPEPPPDPPDQH